MATENKDELLDLIFAAPINLPEVKGPPPKPEVPEVNVVEHKDSDAHDGDDAHSNDGGIAHSETSEKRHDSDARDHEEQEKEDEKDRVPVSEPEYTEIVKENPETEEEHYVMEESYVYEEEPVEEHAHYQEVEEPHDDSSDRGRADSEAKEEEEHIHETEIPAAEPMQMRVVIDDGEHKEEYIEEDVPIHNGFARSGSVSSRGSIDSISHHDHEEPDDTLQTAENYFAYEQEQVRKATLESEEEVPPDFKVDADSIACSEHEESVHEETKSVSSATVSEDHIHYPASLDSTPDRAHEEYDNSNVVMCKREEYPVIQEGDTELFSRRSSRSSYRAISVRRDSGESTQHGTFEPERSHSIQNEVNAAPGVRNLKAMFEHGEPQKARLPRRDSHPPVIDYMNEDSYRREDKPKEQPSEPHHEVRPVTMAEVVEEVKAAPAPAPAPAPTAQTYLPPRAPVVPVDKFQSVRVCKNVRQFVKLWGANPLSPGDPHPLSPVEHVETVASPLEKKHVLKTGEKPGKLTKVMPQPAEPEKKVEAPPVAEPKHEEFKVPDVIFSENYVVDDVMIDDLPVSERKKMFEKMKAVSRRSTQSSVKEPAPKVAEKVEQVKPAVESEPVSEQPQAFSRDEIEKETEEIADALTRLTPVAERRRLFEQNAAL